MAANQQKEAWRSKILVVPDLQLDHNSTTTAKLSHSPPNWDAPDKVCFFESFGSGARVGRFGCCSWLPGPTRMQRGVFRVGDVKVGAARYSERLAPAGACACAGAVRSPCSRRPSDGRCPPWPCAFVPAAATPSATLSRSCEPTADCRVRAQRRCRGAVAFRGDKGRPRKGLGG